MPRLSPGAGITIGERYLLLQRIGQGGYGEVWRATDTTRGQTVAVKLLQEPTAEGLARFRREARAVAELEHPHCLTPYSFGHCERTDRLYLATEYLSGRSLKEWMADSPSITDIIEVGSQLAAALQAAHDLGITHRDVKPSNVVIVESTPLHATLIDFGIARFSEPQAGHDITKTGEILGTPGFMSPEQLRGEPGVGPKSDVYSLGVVLYCAIEGRPVFAADAPLAVCLMHLLEPAPPVRRSDCPPPLRDLVSEMLTKDSAARPSMRDVGRAFGELRETAPLGPARRGATRSERRPSRRLWLFAAALLVLCLFIGVMLTQKEDELPAPVRALAPDVVAAAPDLGPPPIQTVDAETPETDASPSDTDGCGRRHVTDGREDYVVDGAHYEVWRPANYDEERRHAVVFLFQRNFMTTNEFRLRGGFFQSAQNSPPMIVVTLPPSGLTHHWDGVSAQDAIPEVIADLNRTHCIDPERVFAVGQGEGARIAHQAACEGLFEGLALFSYAPRVGAENCALRGTAVLRIIAADDEATPAEGGVGCRNPDELVSLAETDLAFIEASGCRDRAKPWRASVDGADCAQADCAEAANVRCVVEGNHNLQPRPPHAELERTARAVLLGQLEVADRCSPAHGLELGDGSPAEFSTLVLDFFRRHAGL